MTRPNLETIFEGVRLEWRISERVDEWLVTLLSPARLSPEEHQRAVRAAVADWEVLDA